MQTKLHSAIIQFAKVSVGDLNKPTEPINPNGEYMSPNDQTPGIYFIGLPDAKPIKDVTKSLVDKVQLTQSNKMLAEDMKELEPIIRMLKKDSWSFDNDPDCAKRNTIMGILEDFDTP